jgi:putative ABC transport system permease protein
MLISALAFASLLITQQSSVFVGLMRPYVDQVNEAKPLLNTDLMRVRSVPGVGWAVPYFSGIVQARLSSGHFKSIQLIGLDSHSLIGAPPTMLKGRLEDLYQAKAVIVDQVGIEKLSEGRQSPLGVGDLLEINDHEVRIVGICDAARSFFGYPFVYTTFDRAIQISPASRKNLTFILAHPTGQFSKDEVAARIAETTGLKALTDERFFWSTIWWFVRNTGIPISFGTTIFLGFIVGLAVAGQTFYSFILENLRSLGALKAMGCGNGKLCAMLLLQAFTVGFVGYGIGVGLAALFGFGTLKSGQPPFYMPYQIPLFTFCLIVLMCAASALIAIRRISRLEAAEVFRG